LPEIPPLPRYTATATDTSGNTSEFSASMATDIQHKNTKKLPAEFTLRQNYPNPFNPVTTIRYGLPISEVVTLKVFDVLGKEVAVLLDRVRQQAGWYNYEFDAGSLASGLYFYKLDTPQTSFVRKMLYVK